jgi:hypothetical protein
MHNESQADREPEPNKPSKLRKFGPALFWGAVITLPAMNLGAALIQHRTAKLQLELAHLKEIAESATPQ